MFAVAGSNIEFFWAREIFVPCCGVPFGIALVFATAAALYASVRGPGRWLIGIAGVGINAWTSGTTFAATRTGGLAEAAAVVAGVAAGLCLLATVWPRPKKRGAVNPEAVWSITDLPQYPSSRPNDLA